MNASAPDAKISLHRIWWRHGWVLWEGDPLTFEDHRPWTHKRPVAIIATATVAIATAVGVMIGFGLPDYLVAIPIGTAAALGSAIFISEIRFASWVKRNEATEPLDEALRGPTVHHRLFSSERPDGRDAASAVAAAPGLVRRYLREHGTILSRAARRSDQWVSTRDAQRRQPLLGVFEAVEEFRLVSEARGGLGEWDDRFAELSGERTDDDDQRYIDVCGDVVDAANRLIESLPGAVTAPADALSARAVLDLSSVNRVRPLETEVGEPGNGEEDENRSPEDLDEFERRPQAADAAQIATFYRLHGTERLHDLRLNRGVTALDLLITLPGLAIGGWLYASGALSGVAHGLHALSGIGWMFPPEVTAPALAFASVAAYGAAACSITRSRTGRAIAGGLRDAMGFLTVAALTIGSVTGVISQVIGPTLEHIPL